MKNLRIKKLKENGITLVALVVTIIVLLILAGVTISMALGSNGVVERTKSATNTWVKATKDETAIMEQMDSEIEKLTPNFLITNPGIKPASAEDEVKPLSTSETVTLADNKNNIVKVPKNFGIAYDSGDNVADGIVIEYTGTSDTDPLKGNQYVWTPVGQTITKADGTEMSPITLGRYSFDIQRDNNTYVGSGEAHLVQDSKNWAHSVGIRPDGVSSSVYEKSTSNDNENSKAINLEGFVNSVNNNYGFYMARYEAGRGASNNKPYTQSDKTVWNNITQGGASYACRNMYDGSNSDLINSYAWDTTIVFIQMATGNTAYSKNKLPDTSV